MGGWERELHILMSTLYRIQKAVGGPEAEKNKGGDAKEDKFKVLKSSIIKRLGETCDMLENADKTDGGKLFNKADPKAVIEKNQAIRSNIRQLEEDWKQLDAAYQAEKGKRRSKVPAEEMQERRQLLVDLKREITELKTIHQTGVVKGMNGTGTMAIPSSEISKQAVHPGVATDMRPTQLSSEQHARILQIKSRQQEMENKYLSQIEEHVDRLADYARTIQEEERLQSRMIDDLNDRVDSANEHIQNTNARMKETLKNVRAADKFCIDLMCIILMLGLVAVLYAIVKNSGK